MNIRGIRGAVKASRWRLILGLAVGILMVGGQTVQAIEMDLNAVGALHSPLAEHVEQLTFTNMVISGQTKEAFLEVFELGDELFGTPFNALDGGGANVGSGQRFTRTPRADLRGAGEWATHVPRRATGPNAQTCIECHTVPDEDGAGPAAANVSRDPFHSATPGSFINRNTPHVFGLGALQRLAEEVSAELQATRDQALAEARRRGGDVRRALHTRGGVDFGVIVAHANGSVDTSGVRGVDPDLVIRPFQWKGTVATVRDFVRGASHNELGMQAVELVGDNQDGDFDGVSNELTIGDITAITIYNAAQPRPTTRTELASLGLIPALSTDEAAAITNGEAVFEATGCSVCHVGSMVLNDPTFREPSRSPAYRDTVFPGGQNPVTRGVNPEVPISFDLTRDQPDNQIRDKSGRVKARLGAFQKDRQGRAIVRLFGDLKRHEMGPGLAESIDEEGTGASVFLTENLWGAGSTAPYLHDGRATTLAEAILAHGGEAESSRSAFQALSVGEQRDLTAFLGNMVLFKLEADAIVPNSRDDPARPRKSGRR